MKGILFKPWKIKAVAESSPDREWQTRRLDGLKEINKEPESWQCIGDVHSYNSGEPRRIGFEHKNLHLYSITPRYQVSEVVYIKEAWILDPFHPEDIIYRADSNPYIESALKTQLVWWKSPLFMPARAARYFIKITGMRAERLQEITEEDAIKEGVEECSGLRIYPRNKEYETVNDYIMGFVNLWDSINPKYPWEMNPWCFVYSFKRQEMPEIK